VSQTGSAKTGTEKTHVFLYNFCDFQVLVLTNCRLIDGWARSVGSPIQFVIDRMSIRELKVTIHFGDNVGPDLMGTSGDGD
jgi:hypothetical protein